jgi:DNA-binding MurR/RpiR family transcriptional regulator
MAKIPDHIPDTIADSIGKAFATLTRAERQLANTIVENYPVSGLGSITQVAKKAGVSSPTIVRMVKKLGFKGFPEFQGLSPGTTAGRRRPRTAIF